MGELIREARTALHMTQAELGNALGVVQQSVSGWERDGTIPDPPTFNRLCQMLRLRGTDLLTAAGYDLEAGSLPPVEQAIRRDDSLDADQRRGLLSQYRAYRDLNQLREGRRT
jgi:transcriptional regulator with XRE-family HTH domain